MSRLSHQPRAAAGALAIGIGIIFGLGCDEQTEVQRQTRELEAAQKNVGKVTEQLTQDLEHAKADVVRLEQKLAMARQGLTDDVVENQRELTEALQAQEKRVQTELNEASREAQIHNRDTEAAFKALGQTVAPGEQTAAAPAPGDPAPAATPPAPGAPLDAPARDELVPVRGGPEADAGIDEASLPRRPGVPDTANPNSYPAPGAPAPSAAPPPAAAPAPSPEPSAPR